MKQICGKTPEVSYSPDTYPVIQQSIACAKDIDREIVRQTITYYIFQLAAIVFLLSVFSVQLLNMKGQELGVRTPSDPTTTKSKTKLQEAIGWKQWTS